MSEINPAEQCKELVRVNTSIFKSWEPCAFRPLCYCANLKASRFLFFASEYLYYVYASFPTYSSFCFWLKRHSDVQGMEFIYPGGPDPFAIRVNVFNPGFLSFPPGPIEFIFKLFLIRLYIVSELFLNQCQSRSYVGQFVKVPNVFLLTF